ncbi:hypothetical protein L838_4436 [Mycobacterium avium MAV_120709_2344]|nr:hypothetical protein L838_4436 [Mycobacterium avium MAV_120709_2344]
MGRLESTSVNGNRKLNSRQQGAASWYSVAVYTRDEFIGARSRRSRWYADSSTRVR